MIQLSTNHHRDFNRSRACDGGDGVFDDVAILFQQPTADEAVRHAQFKAIAGMLTGRDSGIPLDEFRLSRFFDGTKLEIQGSV